MAVQTCLLVLGCGENKSSPIDKMTHNHFWGICFAVCHDCPLPIHKVFLAIAFRVRTLLTSATFRPYSGAEKAAPIVTQVFLQVETLWNSSNDDKLRLLIGARNLVMYTSMWTINGWSQDLNIPELHGRIFTGAGWAVKLLGSWPL